MKCRFDLFKYYSKGYIILWWFQNMITVVTITKLSVEFNSSLSYFIWVYTNKMNCKRTALSFPPFTPSLLSFRTVLKCFLLNRFSDITCLIRLWLQAQRFPEGLSERAAYWTSKCTRIPRTRARMVKNWKIQRIVRRLRSKKRREGGMSHCRSVFDSMVISINVYRCSDVDHRGLVSYCRSNVKKATLGVNGVIVWAKKVFGLQKKPTRIVYVSKLKWTTTWLVWTKVYFIFFYKNCTQTWNPFDVSGKK